MVNKKIGIIAYIATMLLCAYLTFSSGLIVYMQSLGMRIVVFHPMLPLTAEYSGQFTIMPQIIEFIYVISTWAFFAIIGWRKIKGVEPNSSHD